MSERYGEGIQAHVMRAEQTVKDQASPNDFGVVIDAMIAEHQRKPISDQSLFLAILAPWFALGIGSIGYAIWWASR